VPVVALVACTVTPAPARPMGSFTLPAMDPLAESPCPKAVMAKKKRPNPHKLCFTNNLLIQNATRYDNQ
jgi:hypothetical protein